MGEDVASSDNKTGGRSMVGEVLFFKVFLKFPKIVLYNQLVRNSRENG